ncbi:Sec-independent protein translocase protein TatC [Corynebacterium camporealensis]|uniref:Sec-independent protein translocase protein TatC n=2 Tax=Corynebacterium camporealensis TaxID=161896 RepID=A0A0F6QYB8_9CORY|nr:twin-arginine translocase subunit TatC [Corynebacterium camporealensis]AKE39158.1 twin arginine targeting protein translocase subunit TatC [Corynebacterium camporealensis]AVH88366.1 Sec-independent protein translocase protein TatC [Corynebacterium camporealensis]
MSNAQAGKPARRGRKPQRAKRPSVWQKIQAKRRSKANPTGEMTLVEHLQELRRRVMISLAAVIVASIVGFIWYQWAPFGIPPLGEILRGPYCELPAEKRAMFSPDGECRLLAVSPFEMLMLRLKVGGLAGVVLSSPIWLYQMWAFIVPGLHKNEKRATFAFVTLAVTLFVSGAVLAYVILSVGLEFLMSMGDEFQTTALTGERYFTFLLQLLVIFGVSFEIPLVIIMLNIAGILEYEAVKDKRRIIIVVISIFAALMTPGQDPFSMVALGSAITLLVELAFQFCRINDKRQKRSRPDWMELDDESASGIDSAQPVGAPTPVGSSTPVNSSPVQPPAPSPRPQSAPPAQPQQQTPPPAAGTSYFDDVL